jgi:hypothetical protein
MFPFLYRCTVHAAIPVQPRLRFGGIWFRNMPVKDRRRAIYMGLTDAHIEVLREKLKTLRAMSHFEMNATINATIDVLDRIVDVLEIREILARSDD